MCFCTYASSGSFSATLIQLLSVLCGNYLSMAILVASITRFSMSLVFFRCYNLCIWGSYGLWNLTLVIAFSSTSCTTMTWIADIYRVLMHGLPLSVPEMCKFTVKYAHMLWIEGLNLTPQLIPQFRNWRGILRHTEAYWGMFRRLWNPLCETRSGESRLAELRLILDYLGSDVYMHVYVCDQCWRLLYYYLFSLTTASLLL